MRLFEIIVVAAALLCSILWIIRKGTPGLKFFLALVTGVIAVVQWLVEGYRTPICTWTRALAARVIRRNNLGWEPPNIKPIAPSSLLAPGSQAFPQAVLRQEV